LFFVELFQLPNRIPISKECHHHFYRTQRRPNLVLLWLWWRSERFYGISDSPIWR